MLRRSDGIEDRLDICLTPQPQVWCRGLCKTHPLPRLFLPVASRLSARTGIVLSRLLIPMASAIILGSGLTMIGSSPLDHAQRFIVESQRQSAFRRRHDYMHLPMFAPLPIGLVLAWAWA